MTIVCHSCGADVSDYVRYCETCGADLADPSAPAPAKGRLPAQEWELLVRSDREYFERLEAEGVDFPPAEVRRTFPLTADRVTVGRASTGGEPVDLDLSQPPADAGISHLHALLSRGPDGAWTVADCSSTNGTYLNDQDVPIPPGEAVVLADGDRIHLGAWTSITLQRVPGAPQPELLRDSRSRTSPEGSLPRARR